MVSAGSDVNIFKALADETRLRILRLLCLEELNVWELGNILGLAQPTISRHLAILRNSELVVDRRDGTRVFYRARELENRLSCVADYLEFLSSQDHPDISRLEECLKQRAAGTRLFADSKAAEWDELAQSFQQQPAQLYMLAGLGPKKLTIADLGTGTGLLLPFLAEFGKHVYAVDQSPAMLRRARLRCSRNELDNVSFIQAPLEQLENQLPSCDALVLHFVLHQIARPSALMRILLNLLKPHGRIAIVDRSKHDNEEISRKYGSVWHGFERGQLEEWCKETGLNLITWHSLGGDGNSEDNLPVFVAVAQAAEN